MRRLLLTLVIALLPLAARAELIVQGGGGGSFSSICSGSSNTQVLFNDGGTCAGDADLAWNKTTNTLSVAGKIYAADASGYGWSSNATMAIKRNNSRGSMLFAGDGGNVFSILYTGTFTMLSAGIFGWAATSDPDAAPDTFWTREGAAVLQHGSDSATPVAYLVKGADARAGTDTNTAGANITIASGRGTGTGAVTSLILQTPTVAGAGTGAQTLADRLTLNSTGGVFTGTITSSNTTDVGWAVVAGADTACNTTCTFGCAFGWALSGGNIVGTLLACTDATADACLCIGAS